MSNLTIRARLLLLSGFMLLLLAGSNLYLRSEIVGGQSTLEAGATALNEISATLQSGSRTLTDIGETLKAGSRTLQDDVETVATLTIANKALRAFGEMKFWLTDLEDDDGEPAGETDITGGTKEGGQLGELGGAISVVIFE